LSPQQKRKSSAARKSSSAARPISTSPTRTIPVEDPLLTKEEAANYLGVTLRKIEWMISLREIDRVKVGKLVRFRRSALDTFIEENTIPAERS
jgi:excisionase family DNA binding protein